jgi:carbon storage regulator CsrA
VKRCSFQSRKGFKVLVLTRKTGERIKIDGGIEVTVVRIAGDKVRIGIEAPETTKVNRHEVWEVIQAGKQRFEEKVSQ